MVLRVHSPLLAKGARNGAPRSNLDLQFDIEVLLADPVKLLTSAC